MLVLRPADGEETVTAWKLAIEEHRPVALILSRQNIKNLPHSITAAVRSCPAFETAP